VSFPAPGRILSVEPSISGPLVKLTLKHTAELFNLKFYLKLGTLQTQEIHPSAAPSGKDGVLVFTWDPRKELDPADSQTPVYFAVECENWYFEKSGEPFQTDMIRIPQSADVGEPVYAPDGTCGCPSELSASPASSRSSAAGTAPGRSPPLGSRIKGQGSERSCGTSRPRGCTP